MSTSVCIGRPKLRGHGAGLDQRHHDRMQDGIDHDLRSHSRADGSQMHNACGHGLEDWLCLEHILGDTADQKGDLPRGHAGHAIGNGRIDKADLAG